MQPHVPTQGRIRNTPIIKRLKAEGGRLNTRLPRLQTAPFWVFGLNLQRTKKLLQDAPNYQEIKR